MLIKKPSLSAYFESTVDLRSYDARTLKGNSVEFRTPFYDGEPLSKVLERWMTQLKTLPAAKEWPTLLQFEEDLAHKVGPLSIQKPMVDRMDDVQHYFDGILLPSVPISPLAIEAWKEEYSQIRGLRPRTQLNTWKEMKKSTSSGAPFMMKRKDAIHITVEVATSLNSNGDTIWYLNNVDYLQDDHGDWYQVPVESSKPRSFAPIALCGWRGQEGGPMDDDVKQRVVWMFPMGLNILELTYYQPYIAACQQHGLVPAWISMDRVDEEITQLFDTKGKDDLIVCTDFSKFDQHFNSCMQEAARAGLEFVFGKTDWFTKVFPVKFRIPMYTPLGIFKGPHGMGSGSGGTNPDETTSHRMLQHEAAIENGAKLNRHSQCLGDDGILSYPGITVEQVMHTYTKHGQEMNLTKQYASTQDCVYLRRWHHRDYRPDGICRGVYSTARALGRLAEQERYYDPEVWGPEAVEIRYLSILQNIEWSPFREEFVGFCMKGDKYRLGLDLPGFLDRVDKVARKLVEYMPDFLGYTKSLGKVSAPSTWWIVKYLKSLR